MHFPASRHARVSPWPLPWMLASVACAPTPAASPALASVTAPTPPHVMSSEPEPPYPGFITRQGDRLMAGERPFRFISFNIPNLHYVEDNLPFDGTNPWRLPDAFEIEDALVAIAQLGGRVVRTYTLSVRSPGDTPDVPRHVLGPGRFDEDAFRALDKVLELAQKHELRVIIPFVDNWRWWGGIDEYAAFRGKQSPLGRSEDANAFWTDRELIEDFKRTIHYVLHRRNVFTGIRYKDDPTILAWEPVNEPRDPYAWTREIAAYLKELDPKHLVLDGYHSRGEGPALRESLEDPNVDVVSTHHYPAPFRRLASGIRKNAAKARGKKPYLVGEFGFASLDEMREVLDVVISEGVTGALAWSLRFRSREGGFYWHSEGAGPGVKAYHWPGFASGEAYEERALLSLMRTKAYEIRGRTVPPLPPPASPSLLPIEDVGSISWRGSAGATGYRVERAPATGGPWTALGAELDDASVQHRPLFSDESAPLGQPAYYRVVARNEAGESAPSNVVGPVLPVRHTRVDELGDTSRLARTSGGAALVTEEARHTKEDAHRLSLPKGASATYVVPGRLQTFRFDLYFEKVPTSEEVEVEISQDGTQFRRVRPQMLSFSMPTSAYGFLEPVRLHGEIDGERAATIRLTTRTPGQLARVELGYVP